MSDQRPLSDAERARLSTRVDQFFADLANGPIDNWEPYLGTAAGPFRRTLLVELVIVHLGYQWKAGSRPLIEQYVARYPDELGPIEGVPAALIVEEYRCRLKAGMPKGIDGYRDRFPAQFPSVRDRLLALESQVTWADGRNPSPAAGSGTDAPLRGYETVYRLGGGAFADVWQVRSPSGIEKAMKVVRDKMDKEAAQRELAALERIKNLRNPYILRPEDFFVENKQLHIVYELADGTLRGRLDECVAGRMPGIPEEELFEYVKHAASGLDYLHGQELIHRDIKPDNILLFGSLARVADFGLLRKQEHFLTNQSILAGTMAYMAPEVWEKKGGPAADQYSLAVTYAELRQGRLPVELLPYPDIMFVHIDGQYTFEAVIPEAEQAVVRKALARNPAERFPSCRAFVSELARVTGRALVGPGGSGSQPAIPVLPPPPASPMQHAETLVYPDTTREPPTTERPQPDGSTGKKVAAAVVVLVLLSALVALVVAAFSGGNGTPSSEGGSPSSGGTLPTRTPTTGLPPTPEPPKAWLPTGAKADGPLESVGEKRQAYQWILVPFPVGDKEVPARFRLVRGVMPFYLMEEKVWNRLFRGDPATDPTATVPAVGMTRLEAARFAAKFPGGRLPTAEEWDAAAGGLTVRGKAWVNEKEPSPSRKGKGADENEFGLLDMAGNGREWTASTITDKDGRELAITRGRQSTFEKPLTPAELERQKNAPMTAFADTGNPYTGFRVLIPVPEK